MPTDRPPEYYDALRQLIELKKPLPELRPLLPWTGELCRSPSVELSRSHIANVLERYLANELTEADVADWAELLELRDGLCFEPGQDETLIQAIHELANPLLEGLLTPSTAYSMLQFLRVLHRFLRHQESAVMERMLSGTEYASRFVPQLRSLMVTEMNDGGMGSLRFVSGFSMGARFGKQIAEAHYTDSDGVPVSIAINIDRKGHLFELDVWKVDYTPLKRWPKPEDLRPPEVNRPAT